VAEIHLTECRLLDSLLYDLVQSLDNVYPDQLLVCEMPSVSALMRRYLLPSFDDFLSNLLCRGTTVKVVSRPIHNYQRRHQF
jgi:hypothetical protein